MFYFLIIKKPKIHMKLVYIKLDDSELMPRLAEVQHAILTGILPGLLDPTCYASLRRLLHHDFYDLIPDFTKRYRFALLPLLHLENSVVGFVLDQFPPPVSLT